VPWSTDCQVPSFWKPRGYNERKEGAIDPNCRAFQRAIQVLGRPWTALILGLLHDGPLRFSELEERARGVGAKTLSARLKELEARRILGRHVEAGPPVRVQYALTRKGQAFGSVAEAIERWGNELLADEFPGSPPSQASPGSPKQRRSR
jgi:DNA-binding HxlR family transcriptional regulator